LTKRTIDSEHTQSIPSSIHYTREQISELRITSSLLLQLQAGVLQSNTTTNPTNATKSLTTDTNSTVDFSETHKIQPAAVKYIAESSFVFGFDFLLFAVVVVRHLLSGNIKKPTNAMKKLFAIHLFALLCSGLTMGLIVYAQNQLFVLSNAPIRMAILGFTAIHALVPFVYPILFMGKGMSVAGSIITYFVLLISQFMGPTIVEIMEMANKDPSGKVVTHDPSPVIADVVRFSKEDEPLSTVPRLQKSNTVQHVTKRVRDKLLGHKNTFWLWAYYLLNVLSFSSNCLLLNDFANEVAMLGQK